MFELEFFHSFRQIKIRTTGSGLEFTIYNPEPKASVALLIVPALIWFAFAVFGLLSVAGFISPETLSLGLRLFLAFWTLAWIAGGIFFIRSGLFHACGRIEGRADGIHLSLTRSSPFGTSSSEHAWKDINSVTTFDTTGRPYKGVMIHMKGKMVQIDDHLHPLPAARLLRALNKIQKASLKTQKRAA